jgi:hypothetical protein
MKNWVEPRVYQTRPFSRDGFFYFLGSVKLNVDFSVFGKISGEFPFKLGNTHISLKISGVFPLIVSKSLDFVLFKADNRNISAYICFLCFLYTQ